MAISMRHFLLFLSSFLFSFNLVAQNLNYDPSQENCKRSRYAFQIETQKAAVTGIMILKETADEIAGSMVNEFGVSAIDFIYNKKKDSIKLLSVVSFLNKWYIKKVLKKDLKLSIQLLTDLPGKQPKNYEIDQMDAYLIILNIKRKIKYTFNIMESESPAYETE